MDNIDLRVVKSLEHIDLALLKSLSQMPFHKITVDTICKEAKINRSTFYKYYFDKFDLLDKYLDKVLKELKSNIKADFIKASPQEIQNKSYSTTFRQILDFFWARRYPYQILWHAAIDRHIYNEMIDIIQQQILKELNNNVLDDNSKKSFSILYSYLFANNLMSTVHWWFEYSNQMSIDDVGKLMDDNMHLGLFKAFKQIIN